MKKIYILFLVITSYTCTAQILLNGRLIHELPAKSSVDTGDLIIVANPTTGKPYKARKNQVVAGANGVTDGDKGDITVTGSGGVFTIDGSSVQNGKLAMMGDNTFKGNLSGTTASPQDLTASQVISALGINLKMAYTDTASLSNRINAKQNTLVSGTNIKSVNGNSLIGSGDVTITSSVAWGNITGSNIMLQTDLRDSFEHRIAAGTTGQYWRGDKTWQTLNKAAVGLSAVDNTADVDKPISNATNAALAGKQAQLVSGTNIKTINFQDLLGSGNITISGGSGGGETIDQTLALGNVTDTAIVFNSSATSFYYFKGQPNNYLTDYGAKGVAGRFTAGWSVHDVNGSGRPDVVSWYGYNAGPGGGREISTEPSVQYRIETHYESGGDLIELHHPAIIYNDGIERRLWSVYTQKSGLEPATIIARNNGIEFTNWIDENITWGVLQPGVLAIMQDKRGANMPIFTIGANVDSLGNGTFYSSNYNFTIGHVQNNSNEVRIGRLLSVDSSNITTRIVDNLIVGGLGSANRNLTVFGGITLNNSAGGNILPNYANYNIGAISNKFTNIWGVKGLFDTINVTNMTVTDPIITQGIRINGDLKKLDFNGLYYINVDFGTGEVKHFASGGGYIPTFYSNGAEAMRLTYYRNMLIGTTSDDNSAILNVSSTSKGFLPPRMTKTQRDAISSPATGLVIYQTDNTPGLRCYNGTNWMRYTETAD